ncbi:hypothetical protein ACFL5U_00655 [Candidatus Margulisiibacteriota bacterium]
MKKSPRRVLLLIVYCLLLTPIVIAQTKDLTINGDKVSFEKEKNIIEAEGSVEVVFKNTVLTGNHIVYNTETERVLADKGFVLKYNGIEIEGEKLDYEIKKKDGLAHDVKFVYDGIELTGRQIELAEEKFKLRSSSFTTCDLGSPHYHVTAGEIVLYPEYGWLVAYWGYFWLGSLPVVPMPTYIYDLRAGTEARRNLPPFPEIGSNDEDGTYINQKLAWHLRRELSGSYTLSYYEKKGFGGGLEADYILNEQSKGNMRIYGNAGDRYWGGITHHIYFGSEIEQKPILGFYVLPKLHQFELEAALSFRERINYERVSLTPGLLLKSKQGEFFSKNLKYDAELGLAVIDEENTAKWRRGLGKLKVYGDLPETALGRLTPYLGIDWRFYNNGSRWLKNMGGVDFRKTFSQIVSLGLGYLHYFQIDGQSPFNYEMYRFSSADRLTSDLLFKIGGTGVGVFASYYLDTWSPEDIDYALYLNMHCYDLVVKYRSLRKEFSLGFSLSGG